jgi:DNA mismatch repair protein MutL
MGSAKSETSRILNMLGRVALAHPATGFKLLEKGREVLSLAEGTLKHRVGEILGFNVTNELAPVDWSDGSIHVEGYVSTAQQARLRASHQYFFNNRRSIQSGLISRAVSQSYEVLPPGRFPMAVLFLTLTPEEVDVNVHPTKKEVRFLNEGRIYWAVSKAVQDALRKVSGAPALDLTYETAPGAAAEPAAPLAPVFSYAPPAESSAPAVAEAAEEFRPAEAGNQIRLFQGNLQDTPSPSRILPTEEPDDRSAVRSRGPEVPYLQLHSGFILFGVQSGLMMVNQQAAHERILYEKSMEELRKPGRFSSQQLLFPEVIEFSPGDSRFLEENLPHLQALGFDLEAFGGNAFQLRGLPVEVRPDQAKKVMYDLVQGLLHPDRAFARSEEFLQRLARVYARVTSVRLGEPLDYAQISALMDSLFATQNPYVSPSGSPIVVKLSMEEIHRKFGLKT